MRMMVTLGLVAAMAVATLGTQATAQKQPITGVIGAQIEAFQSDDMGAAFGFASPNIRALFGTPERFATMVEQGYPMVWRPADVRYLELREVAGNLWQRVMVTDDSGGIHMLDYQMIETETGWKINAVQLLKAPGANV